MNSLVLALRLARRELRGGLKGFRIVLACLALGVAAIAGIGSASRGIEDGLRRDARLLLGGDLVFSLVHRSAGGAELAWLAERGTVSTVADLRAMAYVEAGNGNGNGSAPAPGKDRLLVEIKSVDRHYPLYGLAEVDDKRADAGAIAALLAPRNGVAGVLADPLLLARLGLKNGDRLKIGTIRVEIRGALTREPDRTTRLFTLGPRLLVADETLAATGLVQPGSLIFYQHRLKLARAGDSVSVARDAQAAFPEAGWRVRNLSEAAPGLETFIRRLTLYLTLVGLTALLVGGLGIASGIKAWLDGRTGTIATLKCLGAPAALIFRLYLIEVLILAGVAIAIGLTLGSVIPSLLAGPLESVLGLRLDFQLYAMPLTMAAIFGVLTVLLFSLWALGTARDVAPGILFRSAVAPPDGHPRPVYYVATAACGLALAGLAIATAADRMVAVIFVAAILGAFLLFQGAAALVVRSARLASKAGVQRATLRFALANLHRPGTPIARMILSLGLGATVLVTIALIEANFGRQLREQIPAKAPTFFFIDILPQQVADFEAAVARVPGTSGLERTPMLRGRIARINGTPVAEAAVRPDVRWALDSERGLTYSATMPPGTNVTEGQWWPADYSGPPLISFDANLAAGMGLKVGDTLTFNILGREITATIANLRRIQWQSLAINFTVVFAPGPIERAPHTHIASVHVPPAGEIALMNAVTDKLPNVSAIRVRDALDQASSVFDQIGLAVRVTAAVTVFAGLLVLAGAVAAGHRRRVYDAVVFKVLGATRRRILGAFLLEYGLLGLATALLAALFGSIIAWAIMTQAMRAPFTWLAGTAGATAFFAALTALAFGAFATWRAMSQKAAPLLRNE